ncbi:cyclin-dependent protein kinase PHO85 homologue [Theileria orientalis strain Shintoku]|uniref:Cyclin-dependent kinase 2 homolog n=1 Tax=Theileria orientalis strain Shintoku TaxID=869250 RepID=J4DP38_THEOR|nr:cyclin-dependent protein kinase PHO85 homologue [Theileria orientalis strain Shintoku]BAM40034.1 cyclin-dependent protein kinase PHO85 homologue [Theileria orientalis strain Shintoku]|eukprot:XP_009690335.1 cyclin-dependent protein kinase PHO85 homologue [Theileria orientalis strain Shintoku]
MGFSYSMDKKEANNIPVSAENLALDNTLTNENSTSQPKEVDSDSFSDASDESSSIFGDSTSSDNYYDPKWIRPEGIHKPANITESMKFVKLLGKGVYGDVHLCHPKSDPSKLFAVKRVRQAHFPVDSIFGLEQNTIKELHALRSLKRHHVNIVKLFDYCSTVESTNNHSETCIVFYLIFELCDMDLSHFVKENSEAYKPHHMDLIQCALNHANSDDCKIYDLLTYSQNVYINDKLNNKTNLKDKIPLPALDEDLAKVIMYQLLQGLSFLHSNRIIHRDIKPQNILLKKSEVGEDSFATRKSPSRWQVKIADLGLSTIVPPRYVANMTEEVVTLLYRPPELLLGDCKYTTAVDIWSTAVTVAECLIGKPVFRGRTEFSVLMRIICTVGCSPISEVDRLSEKLKYLSTHGNLQTSIPHIQRDPYDSLRKVFTDHFGRPLISELGLDLMVRMLRFLPEERITAKEALKHPWFRGIRKLLKPSVVEKYEKLKCVMPIGYNDMMPLACLGKIKRFNKALKKRKFVHSIGFDSYVAQFMV